MIKLKLFLQQICLTEVGWDDTLSDDLAEKWKTLIEGMRDSIVTRLPRHYLMGVQGNIKSFRLCGFGDASKGAYAGVVYLVIETDMGVTSRIVAAKTRVSPAQTLTIPRLELLAALLLARLIHAIAESLRSEIQLSSLVCYTDSRVALYWIRGVNKSWKLFVQNRVNEIRSLVPESQWRHCAGKSNPADLPSRGMSPAELEKSNLWFSGPDWMADGLPEDEFELDMPQACVAEMKVRSTCCLTVAQEVGVSQVIECENYSNLKRLICVTGNVLCFVNNLKRRSPSSGLQPFVQAETLWIQDVQSVMIQENAFDNLKKQLDLFQDSNRLWRCGGRLELAEIDYGAKHPILLPRNHHFTHLVVLDAHERVMHNGPKETLAELRQKYWIIRGRSLVRYIIHRCVVCRRYEGPAYKAPPPPPLPIFRVKEGPPFTYVGVDFAGPVNLRADMVTGSNGKVWLCLYTCCVVRAVHIDIVFDLSVQSFIRSFKRFTARRGTPIKLVSDNGKTFTSAAKTLKAISENAAVKRLLSGFKIEWQFNIERAAWWGGIFERLIGSMKRCLRKVVGKANLTYDELNTAIIETESVLNSRPISHFSMEDRDEPLTPNHLITGRRLMSLPDGLCYQDIEDDIEITPALLNKRMKHLNKTIDRFWKRWRSEYLLGLREHHRISKGTNKENQVSVGDVVIIHNDSKKRGFWDLGIIEEVLPGKDGLIRGAVVRVCSNGRRATCLRRSICHLYPLEINCQVQPDCVELDSPTVENPTDSSMDQRARPRRAAAALARDRMVAQNLTDSL